jgi:hypothetical protein
MSDTSSMQVSKPIRLAGVHEQVNLPIMLAVQSNLLIQHGLQVDFQIISEGTGRMLDLIDSGEVDLALCVTDAFIAGKAKGKLISTKCHYKA